MGFGEVGIWGWDEMLELKLVIYTYMNMHNIQSNLIALVLFCFFFSFHFHWLIFHKILHALKKRRAHLIITTLDRQDSAH